ncbi:hypothetical protein [Sinosporangium siamense]|uniref:Secreted protein n=1 Tax=Sinosporangium siamense TaxID=1367973 RepID=A0A919RL05_9ACTN|nr:hypothetical protein [Sinosporangium siamense]GII94775.1 hypothetical protein Ssi02_50060 [Sinosporangium siamense]
MIRRILVGTAIVGLAVLGPAATASAAVKHTPVPVSGLDLLGGLVGSGEAQCLGPHKVTEALCKPVLAIEKAVLALLTGGQSIPLNDLIAKLKAAQGSTAAVSGVTSVVPSAG